MHPARALTSLLLVSMSAAPGLSAEPGVVFDVQQSGLFDKTDKAYPIENGRTTVDLRRQPVACPTGLGQMATGREAVNEIVLVFQADRTGEHWLHVTWHPGGSGSEQFELACKGVSAGKSPLVEAQQAPYQERDDRFQVKLRRGKNEITLRRLSGDGLHFVNLVL